MYFIYNKYYNNIIKSDVGIEELSRLLKQNIYNEEQKTNSLEGLDLEGNEITGSCFKSLNLMTSYDCPLVYFNISGNTLSFEGKNNLTEIVLHNKLLRQLSANSCSLDMKTLIAIASNLRKNSSLQLLYMDRPLLESMVKKDEIGDHISRMIGRDCSLFELSLKFHNLQDHGTRLLSEALWDNNYLVSLNLESNNIGIRGYYNNNFNC